MRFLFPIVDGVDELALGGAVAALTTAARAGLANGWGVETVAEDALVTSAGGVRVVPAKMGWGHLKDADVIVVVGGPGVPDRSARDAALTAALRAHLASHDSRRAVAAVGNGAFLLARAGLLEGRRATTARADRDALRERVAEVPAAQRVVWDGRVVTSAGPAAGVELGLELVARFATVDAALRTSELLEVRGWAPVQG